MAVSKRLRYEILRRDNHTCRYCGASAPDVKLQVDHVVPTALGGTDEPSNLVTACEPCNGGKSASNPDSPIVDDVAQDALRWSQAVQRAAELQRQERDQLEDYCEQLRREWTCNFAGYLVPEHEPDRDWHHPPNRDRTYEWIVVDYLGDGEKPVHLADSEDEANTWIDKRHRTMVPPLPKDWDASLHLWLAAGVNLRDLSEAVSIAKRAKHVSNFDRYRYFCGVVWRMLEDRQRIASDLLAKESTDAE